MISLTLGKLHPNKSKPKLIIKTKPLPGLKKSFVTIFPDTENFHLIKDVGQVPYFMSKTGEYHSTIVTYKNSEDYPYLENEVKGLKLVFIPRLGKFLYSDIGVMKYLSSESKNIDVLNLFHFKKDNIVYLLLYKTLNPKGKAYVKLDIDIMFFKKYNSFFFSNYKLKNSLLKRLTRLHIKMTDLFSIETEEAREYLVKIYPELEKKLICIPNGVDVEFISPITAHRTFDQKENLIITVGRIGTAQKNSELLLESLRLTDLRDWKVCIIGPVEESFKTYISSFFDRHPELIDKIIFTGNISERKELLHFYNRAKIFCMTSRFEGFPIAFAEASYFGNYIISTPVSGSSYVTDRGLGIVVEGEPVKFSAAISRAISDGFITENTHRAITAFARTNLSWKTIIHRITSYLDK